MSIRSWALVAAIGVGLFGAFTVKEQFFKKPVTAEAEHGHGGNGAEAKTAGKGGDAHAGHDHGGGKPQPEDAAKAHDGHNHGTEPGAAPEGVVVMSAAQVEAARIETAPAMGGELLKEIVVSGRVVLNGDRQARVVPKLPGTVAKVTKNIGQSVREGEVIAIIESREIADAKSEFLSAWRVEELAKSVNDREQRLWRQRVTAEQEAITAKNALQSATIKLDLAHQKLHSAGLNESEIEALKTAETDEDLKQFAVRAPLTGIVTSRNVTSGQVIGTDREIFTVADLSNVWVDIALAPGDLAFARIGQDVGVTSGATKATGKVVVLSPLIDQATRTAKAFVEVDNADGRWKLGDYVSAELFSGKFAVAMMIPREAIQTFKGGKVVFVSHDKGFQMKPVTIGREDSKNVEVLSGVEFGEAVAISNTFILKAEFGKAEAEHQH